MFQPAEEGLWAKMFIYKEYFKKFKETLRVWKHIINTVDGSTKHQKTDNANIQDVATATHSATPH